MKPPKEADKIPNKIWKLNTTVYELTDGFRPWYISVKNILLSLGVTTSKWNPLVFISHNVDKLEGVMYTHVGDFFVWRISYVH